MARNERRGQKKLTHAQVVQHMRLVGGALDAVATGRMPLGQGVNTCDVELIVASADDLLAKLAEATRVVKRLQKTVACGEFDCCCDCRAAYVVTMPPSADLNRC